MLYRIYTENKNLEELIALCSEYFTGFTVIETKGYWKGIREESVVIEIVSKDLNLNDKVRLLAKEIKEFNNQECVLVVGMSVGSWLE